MLDSVWREHVNAVFRFAMRLTGSHELAEDLAQEAVLKAWESRAQLRSERAMRCWLLKIAANRWHDLLRRKAARPSESSLHTDDHASAFASDTAMVQKEEAALVLAEMEKLPDRQRQVLHLHACEELSLAEIADVLEISADAVKASLYEARKSLRDWQRRRDHSYLERIEN